jgi:hypothetical protein
MFKFPDLHQFLPNFVISSLWKCSAVRRLTCKYAERISRQQSSRISPILGLDQTHRNYNFTIICTAKIDVKKNLSQNVVIAPQFFKAAPGALL